MSTNGKQNKGVVKVRFDTTHAEVELSSSTILFSEFELWARQRFDLSGKGALSFHDKDGSEIIPTGDVSLHEIITIKTTHTPTHTKSSGQPPSPPKQKIKSFGDTAWQALVYLVPYLLLALLAITISPSHSSSSVKKFIDVLVEHLGLALYKNLIMEAYLGFLTWSTSYLFVRRYLNPENPVVFEKFSADAIFGGLAQAAAVLLKGLLK
jgi:hypothetical protein